MHYDENYNIKIKLSESIQEFVIKNVGGGN
jgi:hypothetical protein